ncbi:hypothetical protein L3Q82_002634 [Scortum barcoo]|uniref:Uncharacterized protein n=1 Tax=Scortum barcoo TaxID=214431 RepID=A0ACB8VUM3_9TELE|nr:hypothetical protein L3Q82_002634 [Scortum barcoo]
MEPAAVSSAAPTVETDCRALPLGWRSYTSPEGLKYYVNSSSKANGCHGSTKTGQSKETADVALRKPTANKQPPRRQGRSRSSDEPGPTPTPCQPT